MTLQIYEIIRKLFGIDTELIKNNNRPTRAGELKSWG